MTNPRAGARVALAVLVIALVWRFLLAFIAVPAWEARTGVGSTPDQYPSLAQSLLQRQMLGYMASEGPTTIRGPAFPSWLALGMLVGGSDSRWLGFWTSLPGIAIGTLIARVAARRWGCVPGLVAGSVAVLHPLPGFISARVMGDEFYAALGVSALLLWTFVLRSPAPSRFGAVATGLLLALHMLARSSGLIAFAVAAGFGLIGGRRRVRSTLIMVSVALVPPLAWSARSSSLEGRPVFVHSMVAYNFWVGEGFQRLGGGSGPAGRYRDVLDFVRREAGIETAHPGFWYGSLEPRQVAEIERRLTRSAIRLIVDHPFGYAERFVTGLGSYWFRAQTSTRTLHYLLACLPVLLLAAVGAWSLRGREEGRDSLVTMLLLYVLLHNVAYAAVLPMARLSVQVYPALACLAALGSRCLLTLRAEPGPRAPGAG